MQPTRSDVHVNAPLTNISVAYAQEENKFVAARVFPEVPVDKQSDRYFVYSRADFNTDEMRERAPATESAGSGYTLDNTPTYFAKKYALHKDIDDDTRANSDSVLSPDRDATIFLTRKALIRREKIWAANYFTNASGWSNMLTGVASNPSASQFLAWSNYTSSTPVENVRAAITAIEELTGYTPNKLTLGKAVFDKLVDHPELMDRVKYGQTGGSEADIARVNVQNMAALWGLDEVVVASAIINTGAKGNTYAASASNESNSFILGNNALLTYSPKEPGLQTPSAGYTFSWKGYFGAAANGVRIKRFRMEHLESDRVEIEMAVDLKQVAPDMGFFFYNCL